MSNAITLAERLEQAGSSAAQSWIITELLLNAYPTTIRESVIAAAVPHWFTAEILAVLLDLSVEQAQERYIALQELSIVQPFGNLGCTLHDLTRSGILKNLATEERALLPYYGEKLLTYFVASFDPQHEVERIYHLLLVNPTEGRRVLQQNARFLRNKGDFAALENLLRNYRELIELGWLADEHRLELEQQEYWTATDLADRGKRANDDQSEQYLRKALAQFAPPDQLARLLADEPKQWRDQVDTYKHDFVRNQIESAGLSGDLARQPFWMTEQATLYRDQGDLITALQELNAALTLSPDNVRTLTQRGLTYLLMNRYEEATADFDRAIALDEKDAWAIANRGLTYRLMKRYEEAIADFDRAIALDEKYARAFASRGLTYHLMKRYEEAIADFDRAITLDEKDALAIANRGETYRLMKRYEKAIADFDRAIALDEKMAWAIASRGQVYQVLKRYEKAIADFDRAVAFDEKDAWAIASRGQVYQALNRYEEAIADFDRAIALDEKYVWAIAVRGETYRLMKRYEEAIADFDFTIALDEKYVWAIARRGLTYLIMERHEEALTDFDRAIALDEKMTWAIAVRGEIYRLMKRYEEAIADFDRTIALDEKMDWAITSRGQVYQALKRYEEALADFDHAIALDEKAARAIASRGYIYLLLGRQAEAQTDLNKALSLDENDWRFYWRGLFYLTQNQTENANADVARAIELATADYDKDPHDWRNTLNLMLYHLVAGDNMLAERFLQEAFAGNAPVPRLKDATQDLEELLIVLPDYTQARSFLQWIEAHLASRG